MQGLLTGPGLAILSRLARWQTSQCQPAVAARPELQTPTRAGQGEDISPAQRSQRSQSTPVSNGRIEVDLAQSSPVPVYKNARLGLALPDTGRRHESLQGKDVEPAWKALDALRRSKAMEDLFLRASFDGLGTHLQIPHWITKTLDRICQSADTHYTADVDYDIRLGHPHLWACAVARVAESEGLSAEALSACIDSNFGFLEHTNTALTSKKTGVADANSGGSGRGHFTCAALSKHTWFQPSH